MGCHPSRATCYRGVIGFMEAEITADAPSYHFPLNQWKRQDGDNFGTRWVFKGAVVGSFKLEVVARGQLVDLLPFMKD